MLEVRLDGLGGVEAADVRTDNPLVECGCDGWCQSAQFGSLANLLERADSYGVCIQVS